MIAAALAALAVAASPVQGSVFGPIVSVKGDTFTLTTKLSPNGKSVVSAGSARITEQAAASRSDLKVGACVAANGTRNAKGVVAATRIMITAPVKGTCGGNVTFRGGGPRLRPPRTGTLPPGGGFFRRGGGSFGFAFGSVKSLKGSTLTVKSAFGSTAALTVTISAKTTYSQTETVKASAITVKTCAFVRGTSSDKGVTVKATDIAITPETNGSCTTGFRRPAN